MTIIKTYKANTNVSINVVLPSKKNLHISFTPLTNGSSVFTTDNEDVQKAIESHYRFGTLFRLHSSKGENAQSRTEDAEESDEAGQTSEEDVLTKVPVSDLSSAKDYLADKFGISRTSLRSAKAIMEQAAAHGIEFEGI